MKPVALFLVKNGIGYGHIRRALLVAAEVAERGDLRPIVVSQARTVDLLRSSTVPVLNLPLLHRVPSAVGEDAYLAILQRVIERLRPAVVVEDTYPDPRYGALPALRGVPRVLVLRRLDGESFDTLRTRGAFAPYDRILLAQDPDDVAEEGHSGESLFALRHSARVVGVGNISYVPTEAAIESVRRRHAGPLVVVNGGAGGDQVHDGYGHRFLAACHRTAAGLHSAGHPARFVIVTGPYYAGPPLAPLPNLTVHRFTTTLPALLAAADVAVVKPGNNAVAEALHGSGHLVLVPDASFLEGTREQAVRVASRYGGTVVDAEAIDDAVRTALARTEPRTMRPVPADAVGAAADAISRIVGRPPAVRPRAVCLLLRTANPIPRRPLWAAALEPLSLVAAAAGQVAVADRPPAGLAPQDVVDRGTRLLVSSGAAPTSVTRWLRMMPPSPALPVVTAGFVAVGPYDAPGRVLQAIVRALAEDPTGPAVVLDLRRLPAAAARGTLETIDSWIARQPLDTVSVGHLCDEVATRILCGAGP